LTVCAIPLYDHPKMTLRIAMMIADCSFIVILVLSSLSDYVSSMDQIIAFLSI